jgi:hypothetical protein
MRKGASSGKWQKRPGKEEEVNEFLPINVVGTLLLWKPIQTGWEKASKVIKSENHRWQRNKRDHPLGCSC